MPYSCVAASVDLDVQDPKPVPEAVKQGVESVGKDVGALPTSEHICAQLILPCA